MQEAGGSLTGRLPTIVDAVFGTTPSSNLGLRSIVAGIGVGQGKRLVEDESLIRMLEDHGDLGISVLRRNFDQHDLDLANVKGQIEDNVEKEQAKNRMVRRALKDVSSRLMALFRENEMRRSNT